MIIYCVNIYIIFILCQYIYIIIYIYMYDYVHIYIYMWLYIWFYIYFMIIYNKYTPYIDHTYILLTSTASSDVSSLDVFRVSPPPSCDFLRCHPSTHPAGHLRCRASPWMSGRCFATEKRGNNMYFHGIIISFILILGCLI
jgi:hypothetical protein